MKNENILFRPYTLQNALSKIELPPKNPNDVVVMGIIARDVKLLRDWGKDLPEKERNIFYNVLSGKSVKHDNNHPLLKAHIKLKLIKRAIKEGLEVTDEDIVLVAADSDFMVSDDELEFIHFFEGKRS